MEKLWIGNIAPGTTDDELKALVKKYASELECISIQREEGDGSRPGAVMSFGHTEIDAVGKLSLRLSGMYWKDRKLVCSRMIT